MIRILLADEMEAILFLARWHTFLSELARLTPWSAYRFALLHGEEQLAEEFNFCRAGTGDDLMKTLAIVFPWKKIFHQEQFHCHLPNVCHAFITIQTNWIRNKLDNRKTDFRIKQYIRTSVKLNV